MRQLILVARLALGSDAKHKGRRVRDTRKTHKPTHNKRYTKDPQNRTQQDKGAPMPTTRQPAVAGSFYTSDPVRLAQEVDQLLAAAPESTEYARAVIAPHAGYIYSGPTAAFAHRALDPKTRRVLILGPTHRVGIEGMALTGADYQGTPLGAVPTDAELTATLEDMPDVITAPIVHAQEHSLEVHLPFLQRHLEPGFTVVPVAVGHATPESVAAAIEAALALPDTAVVVSSDLSHFLPYDVARRVDAGTVAQILHRGPPLHPEQACGAYPVNGMMRYAAEHGWDATLLDIRNSGDTAGDRRRVVGYPALAWAPSAPEDSDVEDPAVAGPSAARVANDAGEGGPGEGVTGEDGRGEDAPDQTSVLPTLAYNAIAQELGAPLLAVPTPSQAPTSSKASAPFQVSASSPAPSLREVSASSPLETGGDGGLAKPGATFVTLTWGGKLRGCIGSLEARRALGEDVVANALSAAFRDPRFPPLTAAEFAEVELEVSELSAPQPLWEVGLAPAEPVALDMLRPRVDGVVIRYGSQRATFLPQVWDQLPDPAEFMANLKAKAGLPRDFWSRDISVETYQVREHHLDRQVSARAGAGQPGAGQPDGGQPDGGQPDTDWPRSERRG